VEASIVLFKGIRLGLLASVLAAAFAVPAMATPIIFTLDKWEGSGSVSGNDFGAVTLTQNGSSVDVDVTLTNGNGFTDTGAGEALLLNLHGITTITLGSGPTSGFTLDSASAGSYGNGATGNFNFAIDCTGCSSGGSGILTGPLDFSINNVTIADFQANNNGFYFASDICAGTSTTTKKGVEVTQCSGTPGKTGNVVADDPTPVPEPLTLSLFGVGLVGAAAMRRRKKA
jgi:hypothetical protein